MDHLQRAHAPISEAGWSAIEDEIRPRLTTYLAARKLVDFEGPSGWSHSATALGRVETVAGPGPALEARRRRVLPLVELRAAFSVDRRQLEDVDRGAPDPDLGGLEEAGRRLALGENSAIFHGYGAGGIAGITESTSHPPMTLPADAGHYPTSVAGAVDVLRQAGIGGPYGLAIAPDLFTDIVERTEHGGYLLFDHLRQILGGPLVWAPGLSGGIVLSLRGGDFVIDCGQDISVGYLDHDADTVRLYLEESFSFRVLEPDAAVTLTAPGKPKK
ncbi:MAG TPA: family 1 encapsulin nanocompartment shell protein [Acidimicrobiales bacterium]|nr:family 1 encapsulin nanocompartment shell protein [Acidimicrobiales bacterium]